MSDGMMAIQSRIAEIQRLVNAPSTTQTKTVSTPGTATSTTTTSSGADFAAVLNKAQGGDLTLEQVKAFGNGRIPDHALASIGGKEKLAGPAANAFNKMKADAAAAGISLPVNDSYRSYDEQVDMARRKGLYSQGGLAAKPGTSTHGLGLSVDLEVNAKSSQWLKANAGRYGFVNDVAGEKWHWTYKGK